MGLNSAHESDIIAPAHPRKDDQRWSKIEDKETPNVTPKRSPFHAERRIDEEEFEEQEQDILHPYRSPAGMSGMCPKAERASSAIYLFEIERLKEQLPPLDLRRAWSVPNGKSPKPADPSLFNDFFGAQVACIKFSQAASA